MLPALSVLVRPSRTHRLLLATGGLVLCAVAIVVGADPIHYLGAPAVALAPALAAAVLLGSAARRPKTHRIDISGTGDLRVTVQQGVGPPGGATCRSRDDAPARLLPGSVVWPLLMVLRYGAADGGARVLIVWRDAIDGASWRALTVALSAIGGRGGCAKAGRVHEKIR